MKRADLGGTGLSISVLGLGSWAFGGPWAFGWGEQDQRASEATIRRALEHGINWIDTAPAYGLGQAESVVGRVIATVPAGERPWVFTKCGVRWTERGKLYHSLEPRSVREEAEASLRRLGLEALDLYQIHWPDHPPDGPAKELEEGFETLARLREEGKVRHIGVSNFDVNQLERARRIAPVETLQPPYSLLDRSIEETILPYCAREGIGVITYSPLQSGLLSGHFTRERLEGLPDDDWRKSKSLDFREPRLSEARAVVERLARLAAEHGARVSELAIAWVLRRPEIAGCIVGARSARQLDENVGGASLQLAFPF